MKWTQATKSNLPAEGVKIPLMMGGEYKIGFLRKDIMSFSINGDLFPYSKIKYLDESEPSPVEDVQRMAELEVEKQGWGKYEGTSEQVGIKNGRVFAFVAHADTSIKAQMLMGNDANTLLAAGAVNLAEC